MTNPVTLPLVQIVAGLMAECDRKNLGVDPEKYVSARLAEMNIHGSINVLGVQCSTMTGAGEEPASVPNQT